MVSIYILKLQTNKYYIGKSHNTKIRINDHISENGADWTKKYLPIKILKIINDCDDFDEDKYTLKYMKKYGIDNVRGGSFCQLNLSEGCIKLLNRMINGATNKCYTCGKIGHFIKDCDKKYINKNKKSAIEILKQIKIEGLDSEDTQKLIVLAYTKKLLIIQAIHDNHIREEDILTNRKLLLNSTFSCIVCYGDGGACVGRDFFDEAYNILDTDHREPCLVLQ